MIILASALALIPREIRTFRNSDPVTPQERAAAESAAEALEVLPH